MAYRQHLPWETRCRLCSFRLLCKLSEKAMMDLPIIASIFSIVLLIFSFFRSEYAASDSCLARVFMMYIFHLVLWGEKIPLEIFPHVESWSLYSIVGNPSNHGIPWLMSPSWSFILLFEIVLMLLFELLMLFLFWLSPIVLTRLLNT